VPASSGDLALIRLAIGDSAGVVYSSVEIDALWDDAALLYDDTRVIRQQVIVDALDGLLADSAKRVSYKQNESSENLSDVFKALEKLRDKHAAKLAVLLESQRGSAKIAGLKKVPSRDKEWPDA